MYVYFFVASSLGYEIPLEAEQEGSTALLGIVLHSIKVKIAVTRSNVQGRLSRWIDFKGLVYLIDGVWVEDIMTSSHLILLSRLFKRTVHQCRDSSNLRPPKYASKWGMGLCSLEVTQLWQCASAHPSQDSVWRQTSRQALPNRPALLAPGCD